MAKTKTIDDYNEKGKIDATFFLLLVLAILFLVPVFMVLLNSFKGTVYVSTEPFKFLTSTNFVKLKNYAVGLQRTGFLKAFGYSLFITLASVGVIIVFTSMTAWMITRLKNKLTNAIYFMFAFSMLVPFQMVMFTMSFMANRLHLDNPVGIVLIYLGFGAGQCIFMFCGFIKSIPAEIEEAAMIDGCNPIQIFFSVVMPILKPTVITVSILQTMWIWNDYLLPTLVIGSNYRTIPIAIQYLRGGYGSIDWGAMMAMLVLAILPIIIFYLCCQKYIIDGVVAGAVKG
ncbi:MAG: carbohydrate ABC transporter permease [Clostridiales bacterium]|nr:carbohydrate ABC transporter permease [Clostridiales bacterium]